MQEKYSHAEVEKAARDHSEDMIRRDYFSHNTKGRGETAEERIKRFGYTPDDAFRHLVAVSQKRNVKLRDIARDIVEMAQRGGPRAAGHQ